MGLFDLFARRPALSEGLEQYRNTSGAVLLDVRTPRNTGTATCPERKTCPWIGWIPSPSLPGAHCLSPTAAAGRGAPRPEPGWRGRGIPSPIWGPAGLPRPLEA